MSDAESSRQIFLPTPGDLPCPHCGYLNTPQSERCGVCGQDLIPPQDSPSLTPDPHPQET